MKKTALLLTALISTSTAFACGPQPSAGGPRSLERLSQKLALDEQQKEQLEAFQASTQSYHQRIRSRLLAIDEERTALNSSDADYTDKLEALLAESANLHHEQEQLRNSERIKLVEVLSPEQREQLKSIMDHNRLHHQQNRR